MFHIASFAILSDKFLEQFASIRAEPLRGYIARFNQEKVSILECSIPTAISTFKRGPLPEGDLYMELTKRQCKTMEDVLPRATAQVKWEEDVPAALRRNKSRIPRRSDQTESSETRNPLKDQPVTPEIKAGAYTITDRSRTQKGWQCPRGQTSLTSPSQGRS